MTGVTNPRPSSLSRLDNVLDALDRLPLPVFAADRSGTIQWLNRSAKDVLGDRSGAHFSTVVAPESRARVQDEFTKKVIATATSSEYRAYLLRRDGEHVEVEISSVPISGHGKIIGVFGTARVEHTRGASTGEPPQHLTPRQTQVLRLLARGCSTDQIAAELGVARETARNHIRGVLRSMGVHSRLEAVVAAMGERLI